MSVNHFVNSGRVQCFEIEDLSLIDTKVDGDVIDLCGHKVLHMGVESFAISFPDLGVHDRFSVFDIQGYDVGACGGISNQQVEVVMGVWLVNDLAFA